MSQRIRPYLTVRPISLLALACIILAGCAALGLTKANSADQRVAYAYAQVSASRTEAAHLLDAGKISVATAQQVQNSADLARQSLDTARDIFVITAACESAKSAPEATPAERAADCNTNGSKADAALAASQALLTALNKILLTYGASHANH